MWAEDSVATPVPSRGGRVSLRKFVITLAVLSASCAAPAAADGFVASWAASAHGPYPVGNPTAQPELRFAFPSPERGARDQSFRMIVRPDVWGREARIRLSNAFGTRPVTFDGAFVGLQESGSAIVPGTNPAATFGGNAGVVVPPGGSVVSDPEARVRRLARGPAPEGAQARRELPRRRRERPGDVARQGPDELVPQRAGRGPSGRGRGRGRVPLLDHVVVLPGRARDERAGRHQGAGGLRGLDHRRDGVDPQRRRPLARRAGPPPPRGLRGPPRRGQRGDRRQPGGGAGGVRAGDAVRGRPVGGLAHRA